jgi:hypothetical protein
MILYNHINTQFNTGKATNFEVRAEHSKWPNVSHETLYIQNMRRFWSAKNRSLEEKTSCHKN